ncbi:MAG: PKD domain-containing protein [Gammaproteobacteria bacterium]
MRGARTVRFALAVGGVLLAAALAACGGGGGGSTPTPPPPANQAPTANAGPDQTAVAGGTVTLNGGGSTDPDGSIATFAWIQTAGPSVTLTSASGSTPAFCAPTVAVNTVIIFNLTVTDNGGSASANQDTVSITVTPHPGGNVVIAGDITFARVPLGPDLNALDYLATRQDPARLITVQAVCGGQQVLFSTTTSVTGNYSLTVPANTPLAIRAVSEIVRLAPQWQFRVIDDANASQVYSFTGAVFGSSAPGGAQNVAIPSGWDAPTRTATAARAAAPFAILDTVFRAATTVDGVQPGVSFPALNLDWGPGNAGGQTFYRSGPGTPTIVLSGEANVDTDEYDEHVIAHEFGHYVEDHFSRSDSIGGAHGAGDRLDMRVAFGEGYGYAFAAIVLGDPIARDTFGPGQTRLSFFNIEQNAVSNAGWFSEASNWAILWDLFDAANDDPIQLGLAPIWQVLRNQQAATPALTSIFPFISALKQPLGPIERGQVDQIVNMQSIVSATIEPYGSTETNAGGNPNADVFPIFRVIQIGESQTVRSVAPGQGSSGQGQNKLSNHRFLRLNVPSQQNVRFRATAPIGRDTDIVVFRQGAVMQIGQGPANEDFTIANLPAGDYVLDVYDCENAECADQPSYNYQPTDITVTLSNN